MNNSESSCDEKREGLSKNLRASDSPKITNLASTPTGSPKVRHHAIGYMMAKLVKPGDFVYLEDKLCKVISKNDNLITGIEKNKSTLVNYKIKNANEELRIDMLNPLVYERKVKVTE